MLINSDSWGWPGVSVREDKELITDGDNIEEETEAAADGVIQNKDEPSMRWEAGWVIITIITRTCLSI